MHSIFKSRSKQNKKSNQHHQPVSSDSYHQSLPLTSKSLSSLRSNSSQSYQSHIDQFGQPIAHPLPAFTQSANTKPSNHYSIDSSDPSKELQLLYGYTGLHTELELDLSTTTQIVDLIIKQIKSRALDTPLLFSTHALDISVEGTHSLIRSFVSDQHEFLRDLQIASPHNLSAFLKWILARHVTQQNQHGFLNWTQYCSWREAEKNYDYPPRFITTHLFAHLPTTSARLLSSLLDLFSSVSAYSHLNGMTVHKCGTIFGSFMFGLEDDLPFEETYSNWLRYSHATEHLVLSFLRDQKATSTTGQLASRLESCIRDYPKVIPSLVSTHPSARLECVMRFRRHARFYNKNLIQNAAKWDVNESTTWERLLPHAHHSEPPSASLASLSLSVGSNPTGLPTMTNSFKHLLNIGFDFDLESDENELGQLDLESQQRFKSLVEKEWSGFMNKGFQEPDAKKLEFDLTESERQKRRQKHDTLDWEAFAGNGFAGRETYEPKELQFNTDLSKTVTTWPSEKKELTKKLVKTNKALPPFPYDITPKEANPLFVDDNFFEAWADVLISSGWSREELKEVSWALVHYKCKPLRSQDLDLNLSDGRTDDVWVLFEEVVTREYRDHLMANGEKLNQAANKRSRRTSFLRSMTRRDPKKSVPRSTTSSSRLGVIKEVISSPSASALASPAMFKPTGLSGASLGSRAPSPHLAVAPHTHSMAISESSSSLAYLSHRRPSQSTLSVNESGPYQYHNSSTYSPDRRPSQSALSVNEPGPYQYHSATHPSDRRPSQSTLPVHESPPFQSHTTQPVSRGSSSESGSGGLGYMADFRAKTKSRHQNYNLPRPIAPTEYDHEGSESQVTPTRSHAGVVVPAETPPPLLTRPMNPTPPASSRAVTPMTEPDLTDGESLNRRRTPPFTPPREEEEGGIGAGGVASSARLANEEEARRQARQKKKAIPRRKESLTHVNQLSVAVTAAGGEPFQQQEQRRSPSLNRIIDPEPEPLDPKTLPKSLKPTMIKLPSPTTYSQRQVTSPAFQQQARKVSNNMFEQTDQREMVTNTSPPATRGLVSGGVRQIKLSRVGEAMHEDA